MVVLNPLPYFDVQMRQSSSSVSLTLVFSGFQLKSAELMSELRASKPSGGLIMAWVSSLMAIDCQMIFYYNLIATDRNNLFNPYNRYHLSTITLLP